MESCDVMIIGGGPAGSSCAWQLSRHGFDVAVMDNARFPRDKVCAGWITPEAVQELKLDLEEYERNHVLQPVTAFHTGMIDGKDHETHYNDTVSYGIRRREFDEYLLKRSGAHLLLDQSMNSIRREGRRWIVNDSFSASMVIGAGGHFCPVAKLMGARTDADEPVIAATEVEFEMDELQRYECQVRGDTPEIYFCRDLKGYGWCFRKGDYLNIGLGRDDSHLLEEHLTHFCSFLKQRGRIPQDILDDFKGHDYLLYGNSERKNFDEGMLLIGDAAGLAYSRSGEGIRPAVESGLIAAATIMKTNGDYSRERLLPYARALKLRFGNENTSGNVAPAFLRNMFAGRLLNSEWFTRHVVLDRWFLHNHQEALYAAGD